MPVSNHELEQAVALVAHDLSATLGWRTSQASAFAEQTASELADWWDSELGAYAIKVAEEVQQRLHDTLVDTTWPACPRHPQHPLWLEHDRPVWRCTRENLDVAPLGLLTGGRDRDAAH